MTLSEGKDSFPSTFGRYTLVERLATGGMAEVFKAKIVSGHGFEKLLVIKRILPHLAADKTFVAMFIDEAKLTARLIHPKIVQVTDFGDVDGQYFIALEYVDGFDALALLRSSAQRQIRLPVPICMFIALEVLDALDYAHNAKDQDGKAMSIVHRDISPSNVFISRRGDVKLGDFGIAHAQKRESTTQAGTLKGKYGYMSPEQVVGGAIDARSDTFAVGIVLAEMIMGRRLFTAPNDLDVLLMVRDGRLDRLDKYCKDLSPDLDHLLRTALRKKPAERYQTAAEFREILSDLLFRMGFRVGPADIGRIASDYFDPSPEALDRLRDQARRFRVRAPTAIYPAVTAGQPRPTPPQPDASVSKGGDSMVFEWGVVPAAGAAAPRSHPGSHPSFTSSPSAAPSPSRPAASPVAALQEVEVVIEADAHAEVSRPATSESELAPDPSWPRDDASEGNAFAALDQVLSQPLSIVDLDQYEAPARSNTPARRPTLQPDPHASPAPRPARSPSPAPARAPVSSVDASQPPPGRAAGQSPSPDSNSDLSVLSAMRVMADLAVPLETGLLRFERGSTVKDFYLVRGAPESLTSNQPADRFADYLLGRGSVRPADLERVTAQLSRFSGKLGDALVGMGVLKSLDVFRLQSQYVRERVMEIFSWTEGASSFFRGQRNAAESFPLGLDSYEILGAGALGLSVDFLQSRFSPVAEFRPVALNPPRINPDAFRLGTNPRALLSTLDGQRTIRELIDGKGGSPDRAGLLRTLYLLIESDLARLE